MLPEIWRSVKRLLVLYHFATEDGVAENGFTKDGLAQQPSAPGTISGPSSG